MADLSSKKRSELWVARIRHAAPAVAPAVHGDMRRDLLASASDADGAVAPGEGRRTVRRMADLTAKKRSDLRVAALHDSTAPAPDFGDPADDAVLVELLTAVVSTVTAGGDVRDQARQLAERIDGLTDRLIERRQGADTPVLAEVLPLFELPTLPIDGETCALDAKGRFSCRAARAVLGWEPQDLDLRVEGHWLILTPSGSLTSSRATARLNASDKVTLPSAHQRLLRVAPGRKVYVQPVPDADALALLNPAAVLLGAPLSLLADD